MICKYCKSNHVHKDGNHNGFQRYKCLDCHKRFDGEKYGNKHTYIEYFGIKIKNKPTNRLTRDNYCIPTNKTGGNVRRIIEEAELYKKNNISSFIPSAYQFVDKDTYTDSFVKDHYEDCMYNYDLNMKYFNSIDEKSFNKTLNCYIKKYDFKQVFNLNTAPARGIYLMVLDKYKQVYIGISDNIKRRILQHWSHRKEFRRLIFGSKETSVLSIDSFGAFDTTRIYIKELKIEQDINRIEEKMVANFNDRYSLNRIKGGLNDDTPSPIKELLILSSAKKRNL